MIPWRSLDHCHVFFLLFQQPSGPGKNRTASFFWGGGRGGGGGGRWAVEGGGDHFIFRRLEWGIIRIWEPKKDIINEEELED